MSVPQGGTYPTGSARRGRAKVIVLPVARVSCSVRGSALLVTNSARLPSGDQASSCGAVSLSGQLASRYRAPCGLNRYSAAGPASGTSPCTRPAPSQADLAPRHASGGCSRSGRRGTRRRTGEGRHVSGCSSAVHQRTGRLARPPVTAVRLKLSSATCTASRSSGNLLMSCVNTMVSSSRASGAPMQ